MERMSSLDDARQKPENLPLVFRLFRRLVRGIAGRGWGLHRIAPLSRIYGVVSSTLIPEGVVLVEIDEQNMYIKADGSEIANSLITIGAWEKLETNLFLSLLKPDMTVVDVGANVGYYALLAAKRVAQVYAFEPDPDSFDLLTRSVQANGYTNVKCLRAAVTDKGGRSTFYIDSEAWGNSLCSNNVSKPVKTLDVETVCLDQLYAKGSLGERIHLVKIDVQGAEEMVLKGSANVLARCRPTVLMEVEPRRLRNMGTDPYQLLKHLETDFGYTIRAIEGDGQSLLLGDIISLAERMGTINVVATALLSSPIRRPNFHSKGCEGL